jgi:archaellum component FlaC
MAKKIKDHNKDFMNDINYIGKRVSSIKCSLLSILDELDSIEERLKKLENKNG